MLADDKAGQLRMKPELRGRETRRTCHEAGVLMRRHLCKPKEHLQRHIEGERDQIRQADSFDEAHS